MNVENPINVRGKTLFRRGEKLDLSGPNGGVIKVEIMRDVRFGEHMDCHDMMINGRFPKPGEELSPPLIQEAAKRAYKAQQENKDG